jgi:hypothetical protein
MCVMRPSLTTNESAARWPSSLGSTSPSRPLSLISIGSCVALRLSAAHACATRAPPRSGDPVLGGQPGEARGLGRTGGDRAHEGLEPRPGDEQPARDPVADADGVRDLLGRQEEVAGPQRVRVVSHPQGELAFEDVEAFVFVAVDVQRGWLPDGPKTSISAKPSVCALETWIRAWLSRKVTSSVIKCSLAIA